MMASVVRRSLRKVMERVKKVMEEPRA